MTQGAARLLELRDEVAATRVSDNRRSTEQETSTMYGLLKSPEWSRSFKRLLMIPAFTAEGLLPRGRYSTTPAEIEQRFVMPFPSSATRPGIYDGWLRRRDELLDLVQVAAEWIDGSFVTAKRHAGDIDIVTLIHENHLAGLNIETRQRVFELVVMGRSKLVFGCDSYVLVVVDEGTPGHRAYLAQRGYWDRWWSMYDNQPDRKGYLEVGGR